MGVDIAVQGRCDPTLEKAAVKLGTGRKAMGEECRGLRCPKIPPTSSSIPHALLTV